jgi:hypothetical protein
VNVRDAPAPLDFAIDLGFAAVRGDGLAVFPEFGGEIPVKLSPGGVSENMNCDVVRRQLSFGESFSHQALVDISLDLLETVFVASGWMKETSGESHQISAAKVVSASSTDFAYLAMMAPIASTSAADSRGAAADPVFVGGICFFAGTGKAIAQDSASRIKMSVVARMTGRNLHDMLLQE